MIAFKEDRHVFSPLGSEGATGKKSGFCKTCITQAPKVPDFWLLATVLKQLKELVAIDLTCWLNLASVPVDAVVRKGSSAVDESSITGEAIPREKTMGDKIYAGTLNQNGVVEIETTKVGENTTLGKVIKLVSEAETHRPQAARLVDRYARWFTPVVLSCAGLAWLVTGDVDRAITVLIVGCPCALVLAAPTATVATIGRAARAGILIKKGQFIEESARADVVLFDKTGTLTQGSPRVDKIIPVAGVDDKEVLTLAASVEKNSTHPFARAVLKAAHYARVTLTKAEEVYTRIGLGVQAWVGGKQIQIGSAYLSGGGAMSLPVELRRSLR